MWFLQLLRRFATVCLLALVLLLVYSASAPTAVFGYAFQASVNYERTQGALHDEVRGQSARNPQQRSLLRPQDIAWREGDGTELYCNVLTGVWQSADDRSRDSTKRLLQMEHARQGKVLQAKEDEAVREAEEDEKDDDDWGVTRTTAQELRESMKLPSWLLRQDWVRKQYGWLQAQRGEYEDRIHTRQQSGRRLEPTAQQKGYPPLSAVESLFQAYHSGSSPVSSSSVSTTAVPDSLASPVWSWPLTDLWPMPSLVATGIQEKQLWSAFPGPAPPVRLESILHSIDATASSPWSILSKKRAQAPIHAGRLHDTLASMAGQAWHGRDSIRHNESASTWDGFLSPLLAFRLSARSRHVLQGHSGQRTVVREAMGRACVHLAASYSGRLLQAVGHVYGAARDSGYCRLHDPYARGLDAEDRQAETDQGSSRGTGEDRRSNRESQPMRGAAVLHALDLDILGADTSRLSSLSDPLPHINATESYSLRVDLASLLSQPVEPGARTGAQELTALLTAPTVWGALRGLQTWVQTVSSWGVLQPGARSSGGSPLDSPLISILSCAPRARQSTAACRVRPAYAAASAALAIAESEAALTGGPECALDFLGNMTGDALASYRHDLTFPALIRLPLLVLDRPWKPWRGISLDTARHWLPVTGVYSLLDGMEASKLSVLHWHISDAQSFPLNLTRHPEIAQQGTWSVDKVYSPADVRAIVSYAAARGVRVVPEVDMPAHAAALGKSHPQVLVHCNNVGGSLKDMDKFALDPSSEAAYDLLDDILGEMSTLFPDDYFHVGADEVAPECWASQEALIEWTKTNLGHLLQLQGWEAGSRWGPRTDQVYVALLAYFLHRVQALLQKHGKLMVSWEDSYEKVHAVGGRLRVNKPGTKRRNRAVALRAYKLRSMVAQSSPAATPTPVEPSTVLYPPGSLIQGWKSWVEHADSVLLEAALDGLGFQAGTQRQGANGSWVPLIDPSSLADSSAGRGVLNSAGWYLDYSSPWADVYRHWTLPEHHGQMARYKAAMDKYFLVLRNSSSSGASDGQQQTSGSAMGYPAELFAPHPYWGGEGAMWTERIDASNMGCRVWPRLGAAAEVLWSESLAYDRYTRVHSPEDGRYTAPTPAMEHAVALFAAPRFLQFTRMLLHRGIQASPTAVFDVTRAGGREGGPAPPLFVAIEEAEQQFGFNGLCPGIEQGIQRPAYRLKSFIGSVAGGFGAAKSLPSPADMKASAYGPASHPSLTADQQTDSAPKLKFVTWNIHDGGISRGRYAGILKYLSAMDADVVGIVEANGWNTRGTRALLVGGVQDRRRRLAEDATDSAPELSAVASERIERLLPETAPAHDLEPRLQDQSVAFRRRAGAAGYTYSHILLVSAGYHLALLSSRPMSVVLTDTTHFSRGLLVADVAGVRFLLVHLHAHSAAERAKEALHVRALVALYTAAGIPTILMGDLNSPSPVDSKCHDAQMLPELVQKPTSPAYLRTKYLCRADLDKGCSQMEPAVDFVRPAGPDGEPPSEVWRVDYRPLQALLHAPDEARGRRGAPLVDLTMRTRSQEWMARKQWGNGRSCLVTYPTSSLAADADDAGDDNGGIALRIDFALANTLAMAEYPALACHVGLPAGKRVNGSHILDHELLTLSDHLPLICTG